MKDCLSEAGCSYRGVSNSGYNCSFEGSCSYQRPSEIVTYNVNYYAEVKIVLDLILAELIAIRTQKMG